MALRRAPDVRQACVQAFGPAQGQASVISLRSLQGAVGAFEWRKNGVEVPGMGEALRIYPHYGVFSPVRGEYVDLVAQAPLPEALKAQSLAFDVGVGTGVLSAVLARRGVAQVVGSDLSERAVACARDNLQRLGLQTRCLCCKRICSRQGKRPWSCATRRGCPHARWVCSTKPCTTRAARCSRAF